MLAPSAGSVRSAAIDLSGAVAVREAPVRGSKNRRNNVRIPDRLTGLSVALLTQRRSIGYYSSAGLPGGEITETVWRQQHDRPSCPLMTRRHPRRDLPRARGRLRRCDHGERHAARRRRLRHEALGAREVVATIQRILREVDARSVALALEGRIRVRAMSVAAASASNFAAQVVVLHAPDRSKVSALSARPRAFPTPPPSG